MQSYIERIESSIIINFRLSTNDMSTTRIEDDPYFKTDHEQQLIEGVCLLIKHALLRGRRIVQLCMNGKVRPFHIVDQRFYYRDPLIKEYIQMWMAMETVDRTFFLIDSQRNFEEEYQRKMTMDLIQLEELFE